MLKIYWSTQKISRNVIGLIFLLLIILFTRQLHPSHFEGTLTSWAPTPRLSQYQTGHIDWSRFAYSQYVTGEDVLCNSLMLFESLHRLESKADRVLMHPLGWQVAEMGNDTDVVGTLLKQAREEYNVKLVPVKVQTRAGGDRKSDLVY